MDDIIEFTLSTLSNNLELLKDYAKNKPDDIRNIEYKVYNLLQTISLWIEKVENKSNWKKILNDMYDNAELFLEELKNNSCVSKINNKENKLSNKQIFDFDRHLIDANLSEKDRENIRGTIFTVNEFNKPNTSNICNKPLSFSA